MDNCIRCKSFAINHQSHGRDGSDPDLCDVCYWRKRAHEKTNHDKDVTASPLKAGRLDLGIDIRFQIFNGKIFDGLTIWAGYKSLSLNADEALALRDFLNSQSQGDAK